MKIQEIKNQLQKELDLDQLGEGTRKKVSSETGLDYCAYYIQGMMEKHHLSFDETLTHLEIMLNESTLY